MKLVPIVLAAAALSGCSGCFPEVEVKEPTREQYAKEIGSVFLPWTNKGNIAGAVYIRDVDHDAKADCIDVMGRAYFFAEGYKEQCRSLDKAAQMTPEMRDAASAALSADQNLAFMIHQYHFNNTQ